LYAIDKPEVKESVNSALKLHKFTTELVIELNSGISGQHSKPTYKYSGCQFLLKYSPYQNCFRWLFFVVKGPAADATDALQP
jgi:hypothetical protein